MIGKIFGLIEEKNTHSVLVNVQGLCYEVEVPITTSFSLPEIGADVSLFTHFVVREDAQLLYGFLNKQDRDMFRVLIKVNGVGPKLGIAILSGLDSVALARCVIHDEVSTLVKLPGIGKKTAERLLIELRDKVKGMDVENSSEVSQQTNIPCTISIHDEAESALISLGYRPQDAAKAIKNVKTDNQSLEELLKAALKGMI
ncbi:MAG: Holliday junction DNA helicase RuvA [Oleiphilaceae bacterium]|jgi:Holliday junction DNA helicase RuvA